MFPHLYLLDILEAVIPSDTDLAGHPAKFPRQGSCPSCRDCQTNNQKDPIQSTLHRLSGFSRYSRGVCRYPFEFSWRYSYTFDLALSRLSVRPQASPITVISRISCHKSPNHATPRSNNPPGSFNPLSMQKTLCACLLYGPLFFSLFLPSTAATRRSLLANTNPSTLAPDNLPSDLPDLPNENFGYSIHYTNPLISARPCLMLSVFAMRDLALQDFESKFEGKTWAMYSYSEVEISFTPKAAVASTVRWALWSLAAANRDMLVRSRFQTAQFDTHYSGVQIGVLKFFVPDYSIGGEAGTNDTLFTPSLPSRPASAGTGTNLVLSNPPDLEDDPRSFKVELNFKTTDIPERDIFMSVVQALLNLGPFNSTERVTQPISLVGNALTVQISTSFKNVERSSPPFLLYRHVIIALAALPRVMLREGKFAEVDIRVLIDEVEVGRGLIRQGPLTGSMAPVTGDVSVS